jgi:hypothetical protein
MSRVLSELEAEDSARIQRAWDEYREMLRFDPVKSIVLASRAYRASYARTGTWDSSDDEGPLRPLREMWSQIETARVRLREMLRERETYQELVFAEERELFEAVVRSRPDEYRRYSAAMIRGCVDDALTLLRSDSSCPYKRRADLLRRLDELSDIRRKIREVSSQ